MDLERISSEELVAEMRKAGIERLDQVKWVVVETDGKLTYIAHRPEETHPQPGEKHIQ